MWGGGGGEGEGLVSEEVHFQNFYSNHDKPELNRAFPVKPLGGYNM